jgi:hypothetical protein
MIYMPALARFLDEMLDTGKTSLPWRDNTGI